MTHYWQPRVSTPKDAPKDWRSPLDKDASQRDRDRLFVRALAGAFLRGDHLPAVTGVEFRLIG